MTGFGPLLEFLAALRPITACEVEGWQIQPVTGGRNNLLFRAVQGEQDLAVKFYRIDERDRAGREFAALTVLSQALPGLAPAPLLIERSRFGNPMVVQSWITGESSDTPPRSEQEWSRLVEHLAAIHQVRPQHVRQPLQEGALNFSNAPAAVRLILDEIHQLPVGACPAELSVLARRLESTHFPDWPEPELCLGRCDPYIINFLRRPGPWASVDWENSGWVDPAFEIGDLMTHPCYRSVADDQWEVYLRNSALLHSGDATFSLRARVYAVILLVRWARVFARFLWERTNSVTGPEPLAQWPQSWWDSLPGELARVLNQARAGLNDFASQGQPL